VVTVANGKAFEEGNQGGRFAIRQRPDQGCIDKGKDSRAGGNTEAEYQDGSEGKARALTQLAEGEPEILQNGCKQWCFPRDRV
jgi:hypothetical protein